jgi:hypothetical protein
MTYIAFKMPDVAAGSCGKSSESSRKYRLCMGHRTGVMFAWQLDGCTYFKRNECTTLMLLSVNVQSSIWQSGTRKKLVSVNVQSPIWQSGTEVFSPKFNWVHWEGSSALLARDPQS